MQTNSRSFGQRVLDFFIFSNLFVALPITCLSRVTFLRYGEVPDMPLFLGFVYLASFALYGFHRLWGIQKLDEHNCSERHLWARRNYRLFVAVIGLAALGLIPLVLTLGWSLILPLLPAALIALGYTVPIIPVRSGWWRFRDIPGSKVFLIGLVVAYVTFMLPLLALDGFAEGLQTTGLFVGQVAFLVAITLPFDIRDFAFDHRSGLSTIPTLIGIRATVWVSVLVLLAVSALHVYLWSTGLLSQSMLVGFLISQLFAIVVIAQTRSSRSEYFYSLLVEGTMIVQWACLEIAVQYF